MGLTLASLLLTGVGVLHTTSNHELQLALVNWLTGAAACPRDPFAETLHAYVTPVWYAVAAVSRLLPLDAAG